MLGFPNSALTLAMISVAPNLTRAEPFACGMTPVSTERALNCSRLRPSVRMSCAMPPRMKCFSPSESPTIVLCFLAPDSDEKARRIPGRRGSLAAARRGGAGRRGGC
uniref:Secreted protein n=1 Tax=Arundo donax TaxID=35708 RepID=A0A0A9DDX9_ARUDO